MAADAPSSAPAPPSTEAETEAAAVGRSLKTILGAVAAVLGVVASATALIFTFAPDLQPSPAPETQSAELSELRVDEGATFAQYLARIDQPRDGYTEALLQRRGALLDFRVRIEGFKDRTLVLKWELFDRATGDQVDSRPRSRSRQRTRRTRRPGSFGSRCQPRAARSSRSSSSSSRRRITS